MEKPRKSKTESVLSEHELTKRSTDQNVDQWKTIDVSRKIERIREIVTLLSKTFIRKLIDISKLIGNKSHVKT